VLPLVTHVEYAPPALLRLEKDALLTLEKMDGTDRQTDGWTPDLYVTLTVRRSQRNKFSRGRAVAVIKPAIPATNAT